MSHQENTNPEDRGNRRLVEDAIRISALGLLIYWCFLIFRPFLMIVTWGVIIAVAAFPVFTRFTKVVRGHRGLAATILVLSAVGLVVIPGIVLTGSIARSTKGIIRELDRGTLKVGPPDERIRNWPLVGDQAYFFWEKASFSLEETVQQYKVEIRAAAGRLFRNLAGIGKDILITLLAMIIAGPLLVNADSAHRASHAFFTRMLGDEGADYSDVARDTIRNVVKGVILVALIQSTLAWLGFYLVGLPAAGVWAVLVLLLAVIQLPPLIIIFPLIFYVFSYASTWAAVAFALWGILVSISDALLKPVLLGRGLNIPMPVILIGALGGMMLHGIIGLFIGAVVMALGYKLYLSWLNNWDMESAENPGPSPDGEK